MTGKNQTLARRRWLKSHAKKHVASLPSAPDTTSQQGESTMKHPVRTFFIIGSLVLLSVCGLVGIAALNAVFGTHFTATTQPEIGSVPVLDTSDQNVWNLPHEEGQMTLDGSVVYDQTSKEGEHTVTGEIYEGQSLVVIAYRATLPDGQLFDQGILFVIDGPADLYKYPFTYRDGAATLVSTGTGVQSKLNSVYVDVCRGDRLPDNSAWSYSPWALSNVFLSDEYAFPNVPEDCFSASEDFWPNNPPSSVGYETTTSSDSADSTTTGERLDTNTNGGPISFAAGTPVIGYEIQLSNGTTYSGCYLADPTLADTVTDGVVFPWENEIAKVPACK